VVFVIGAVVVAEGAEVVAVRVVVWGLSLQPISGTLVSAIITSNIKTIFFTVLLFPFLNLDE
jgi:hypothetical protein